MSTEHTPTRVQRDVLADLQRILIESSKAEYIDTGDAIDVIGNAESALRSALAAHDALVAALREIEALCTGPAKRGVDVVHALGAVLLRTRAALAAVAE